MEGGLRSDSQRPCKTGCASYGLAFDRRMFTEELLMPEETIAVLETVLMARPRRDKFELEEIVENDGSSLVNFPSKLAASGHFHATASWQA